VGAGPTPRISGCWNIKSIQDIPSPSLGVGPTEASYGRGLGTLDGDLERLVKPSFTFAKKLFLSDGKDIVEGKEANVLMWITRASSHVKIHVRAVRTEERFAESPIGSDKVGRGPLKWAFTRLTCEALRSRGRFTAKVVTRLGPGKP